MVQLVFVVAENYFIFLLIIDFYSREISIFTGNGNRKLLGDNRTWSVAKLVLIIKQVLSVFSLNVDAA